MTAQFNDTFRLDRHDYAVAGISEGELFNPRLLGLAPVGTCTACYRGYVARFAMSEDQLVLDELHVNLGTDERYTPIAAPCVNNVAPTALRDEGDVFEYHYEGLDYHLAYTGGLLLGEGFIERLYVHMGFHPAWKYQRVIELAFADGVLHKQTDQSDRMAVFRRRVLAEDGASRRVRRLTDDEIRQFIEDAFARSYPL